MLQEDVRFAHRARYGGPHGAVALGRRAPSTIALGPWCAIPRQAQAAGVFIYQLESDPPAQILDWFVKRWQIAISFEEPGAYLEWQPDESAVAGRCVRFQARVDGD